MLKKLAPYTRGYRWYILLGVLCSVGESVLELELPRAMSEIVDVGIANGDRGYILLTGLKMFLMAMAALLCGVGAAALAAKAAMGFGANLRQAEYEQVQRFSFANIEHFSTASLITRLTNDVSSVQMTMFMGMRMCVRAGDAGDGADKGHADQSGPEPGVPGGSAAADPRGGHRHPLRRAVFHGAAERHR